MLVIKYFGSPLLTVKWLSYVYVRQLLSQSHGIIRVPRDLLQAVVVVRWGKAVQALTSQAGELPGVETAWLAWSLLLCFVVERFLPSCSPSCVFFLRISVVFEFQGVFREMKYYLTVLHIFRSDVCVAEGCYCWTRMFLCSGVVQL